MEWKEYAEMLEKDLATSASVAKPAVKPSSTARRAADYLVTGVKAAMTLPETAVGIADLATGGKAGKVVEDYTPIQFRKSREILDTMYSPEQQAANRKVQEADGFVDTLTTAIQNPSTIAHTVVESAPSIIAGGGIGRLGVKAGMSAAVAAGLGEGAVAAGQNAEQVRQQTKDGELTLGQSATLAASGALTAGISSAAGKLVSSKLGKKLGLVDPEMMIAEGTTGVGTTKGIARRILGGAVNEGILEETPQSAQEQAAQNIALGKPVGEGVSSAAAMGLLAGAATGAVGGAVSKPRQANPVAQTALQTTAQNIEGEQARALLAMLSQGELARGAGGNVSALLENLRPSTDNVLNPEVTPTAAPSSLIALDPNNVSVVQNLNDGTYTIYDHGSRSTVESGFASPELARQRAAELSSGFRTPEQQQAAFDAANPVIPNAPDTTPAGNPYQTFGAQQTTFNNTTFTPEVPQRTSRDILAGTEPTIPQTNFTTVPELAPVWATRNDTLTTEEAAAADTAWNNDPAAYQVAIEEVRAELAGTSAENNSSYDNAIHREVIRRLGQQAPATPTIAPAPEAGNTQTAEPTSLAPAWAAYNAQPTTAETDSAMALYNQDPTGYQEIASAVREEITAAGYNPSAYNSAITREAVRRIQERQAQAPVPAAEPAQADPNDVLTPEQRAEAENLIAVTEARSLSSLTAQDTTDTTSPRLLDSGRRAARLITSLPAAVRNNPPPLIRELQARTGVEMQVEGRVLVDMIRNGSDVNALLTYIEDNSTVRFHATLAEKLRSVLQDRNLTTGIIPGNVDTRGSYHRVNGVISLNERYATEQTFLHECLHAATVNGIRGNNRLKTDIKNLVVRIYNAARANGQDPNTYYGFDFGQDRNQPAGANGRLPKFNRDITLSDVSDTMAVEFIAEAMTRREFQELLATIPYTPTRTQTVWSSFTRAVMRFLGYDMSVKNETALGEALALGYDAMVATPSNDPAFITQYNLQRLPNGFSAVTPTTETRILVEAYANNEPRLYRQLEQAGRTTLEQAGYPADEIDMQDSEAYNGLRNWIADQIRGQQTAALPQGMDGSEPAPNASERINAFRAADPTMADAAQAQATLQLRTAGFSMSAMNTVGSPAYNARINFMVNASASALGGSTTPAVPSWAVTTAAPLFNSEQRLMDTYRTGTQAMEWNRTIQQLVDELNSAGIADTSAYTTAIRRQAIYIMSQQNNSAAPSTNQTVPEAALTAIQNNRNTTLDEFLFGIFDELTTTPAHYQQIADYSINTLLTNPDSIPNAPLVNMDTEAVLTQLEAQGFSTLREVYDAANNATTGASGVADPNAPTHDELKAIVTAPLTTEEADRYNRIKSELVAAATSSVRTNLDTALGRIWDKIKTRMDFRWGGTNADSFSGIARAINSKLEAEGSNIRVKISVRTTAGEFRTNPRNTTVPGNRMYNMKFKFSLDGGRTWRLAKDYINNVNTGGGGACFLTGYDNPRRSAPGYERLGGLFYYIGQLAARNIPGVAISSGGMTSINQQRRVENAFSFLARYGEIPNVRISSDGLDLRNDTANKYANLVVNTYGQGRTSASEIVKYLARYTFDFDSKQIKDRATGVVVPANYIAAFMRSGAHAMAFDSNFTSDLTAGTSTQTSMAFSPVTVERAIINQTIVERVTQASNIEQEVRNIRRAAGEGVMFPPVLYNRVGDVEVSGIKAETLTEGLQDIASALGTKGIPVRVIQSMTEMEGYNPDMPIFNAAFHNGAVWVVADYVSSVDEAKALVLDHEVRHLGLRTVLGGELDTFLKRTWFAHRDKVVAFAKEKGIITDGNGKDAEGNDKRLEAAEEYIVSLAQEAKNTPLLDRAIATIRRALRAMGVSLAVSHRELREIVSRAGSEYGANPDFFSRFFDKWNAANAPVRVADPEPLFNRLTPGVTGSQLTKIADKATDIIGGKTMELLKNAGNYVYTRFAPQDRIIDMALSRPMFQIIKEPLLALKKYRAERASIADSIMSAGQTRYEALESKLENKEQLAAVQNLLAMGTVYGIYSDRAIDDRQDWNAESWAEAKQQEKHGKSFSEAYAEVRGLYQSLPDGAKQAYVDILKHMSELRERQRAGMLAMVDKITPETTPENGEAVTRNGMVVYEGERERMKRKVNEKFHYVKGPYAPLTRFGKFAVNVYAADPNAVDGLGERLEMRKFEWKSDADKFMQDMLAEGKVANVTLDAEYHKVKTEIPTGFLTKLEEVTNDLGLSAEAKEELQDQFVRIWASLTPEASALKYNLKRTGLKGFDEDMLRGYLQNVQSNARTISFLERGLQVRQQFLDMDNIIQAESEGVDGKDYTKAKELVNTIRRNENTISGEKVADWVQHATKLPFLWYLASPSVYLVQSSQPFMIAAPRIGVKYGLASALKAIAKHYRQQLGKKDGNFAYSNERISKFDATANTFLNIEAMEEVTPEEQALKAKARKDFDKTVAALTEEDRMMLGMQIAAKWGAIDITLAHDAYDIITNGSKSAVNKGMNYASFFMRTSEIMSRKATFAAAFELARGKGGKSFDEAVKEATATIKDTLYDYAKANRPTAFTGNAGRLLGQFRIFQAHTIMKMAQLAHDSFATPFEGESSADFQKRRSEARSELKMNMGMSIFLAGAQGFPLTGMALGLVQLLKDAFGDDEDPFDVEAEFNNSLEKWGVAGSFMAKGFPALMGVDVSRRIGMGAIFDIVQGQPPENLQGAQKAAWYTQKLAGPLAGVGTDIFKSKDALEDGDFGKLLRTASPKFLKDMAKAYEATVGEGVVSPSGKVLLQSTELDAWQVALMAVGINPDEVSVATTKNINVQRLSTKVSNMRGDVVKEFAKAIENEDVDAQNEALTKLAAFNAKNPEFAINGSDVRGAVVEGIRKKAGLPSKTEAKIMRRFDMGADEEEADVAG